MHEKVEDKAEEVKEESTQQLPEEEKEKSVVDGKARDSD